MKLEQLLTHENVLVRKLVKALIPLEVYHLKDINVILDPGTDIDFALYYYKDKKPTSIWIVLRNTHLKWKGDAYIVYGENLGGAVYETIEELIDFLERYARRIKRNEI